jgi:hypothetical protein
LTGEEEVEGIGISRILTRFGDALVFNNICAENLD